MTDTATYAAAMLKAFGISNLGINECFGEQRYYRDIFSHDFAKAFWGEKTKTDRIYDCDYEIVDDRSLPAWQYHLQQMVLEKEPLKYLEKFL